jgi:hypothetical protein
VVRADRKVGGRAEALAPHLRSLFRTSRLPKCRFYLAAIWVAAGFSDMLDWNAGAETIPITIDENL